MKYKVKAGQTFPQIAQENNLDSKKLIQANPGVAKLSRGQIINFPPPPPVPQASNLLNKINTFTQNPFGSLPSVQPFVNTFNNLPKSQVTYGPPQPFQYQVPGQPPFGQPVNPAINTWANQVLPNMKGQPTGYNTNAPQPYNSQRAPYNQQQRQGEYNPSSPQPVYNPTTATYATGNNTGNSAAIASSNTGAFSSYQDPWDRQAYTPERVNNVLNSLIASGQKTIVLSDQAMVSAGVNPADATANGWSFDPLTKTWSTNNAGGSQQATTPPQGGGWSSPSGYYMNTPGTKGNYSGTSVRNPKGNLVENKARRRRQADRAEQQQQQQYTYTPVQIQTPIYQNVNNVNTNVSTG